MGGGESLWPRSPLHLSMCSNSCTPTGVSQVVLTSVAGINKEENRAELGAHCRQNQTAN